MSSNVQGPGNDNSSRSMLIFTVIIAPLLVSLCAGLVVLVVEYTWFQNQDRTEVASATTQPLEMQTSYNPNLVFRDSFVDNRNSWFTGVFQEVEEDRIEDGFFKVIWSDAGSSYELYEVRDISNFIIEVDCLIRIGGVDASCGLVFGQKDDVGFYKYEVFEDYYRLFIVSADADPVLLVEGDPAAIIKPSELNKLRVIKRGDEIRLFLNDVALDTVNDATYPNGKVGVSTNSYIEQAPAEIWFDNFAIWEL